MNSTRSPTEPRASKRAPIASDQGNPNPSITTSVPRELYRAFEMLARAKGQTKSVYLRELMTEHVKEHGLKGAET